MWVLHFFFASILKEILCYKMVDFDHFLLLFTVARTMLDCEVQLTIRGAVTCGSTPCVISLCHSPLKEMLKIIFISQQQTDLTAFLSLNSDGRCLEDSC